MEQECLNSKALKTFPELSRGKTDHSFPYMPPYSVQISLIVSVIFFLKQIYLTQLVWEFIEGMIKYLYFA